MSNNLDLKDLMSAELFKEYGLTIIARIIVLILHEHSETWTLMDVNFTTDINEISIISLVLCITDGQFTNFTTDISEISIISLIYALRMDNSPTLQLK